MKLPVPARFAVMLFRLSSREVDAMVAMTWMLAAYYHHHLMSFSHYRRLCHCAGSKIHLRRARYQRLYRQFQRRSSAHRRCDFAGCARMADIGCAARRRWQLSKQPLEEASTDGVASRNFDSLAKKPLETDAQPKLQLAKRHTTEDNEVHARPREASGYRQPIDAVGGELLLAKEKIRHRVQPGIFDGVRHSRASVALPPQSRN